MHKVGIQFMGEFRMTRRRYPILFLIADELLARRHSCFRSPVSSSSSFLFLARKMAVHVYSTRRDAEDAGFLSDALFTKLVAFALPEPSEWHAELDLPY